MKNWLAILACIAALSISCKKLEPLPSATEQSVIDDKKILDFFSANGISAFSKTNNGTYVVIDTANAAGTAVAKGMVAFVKYQGKLIANEQTVFDSNLGKETTFQFEVGASEVIRGWDEGVTKLRVGESARLFIPSGQAYGSASPSAAIPTRSCLQFYIKVINAQ